jgi:hypothetical protein
MRYEIHAPTTIRSEMGTWGVAVFADDVAMDVRGDWREAILAGQDPAAATETLEAAYADQGPDDAIIFWLALAAAQMETGRLLDRVRDRAVAIIDAGADVERWQEESDGLARQRAKVLDRLRKKLVGPQPTPKRLRRPPTAVQFDVGDVVFIHNREFDRYATILVVDHYESEGQKHPVVEWIILAEGTRVRTKDDIAQAPIWRADDGRPFLFLVTTDSRDEVFGPHIGKVGVKGVNRPPSGDYRSGIVPFGSPCVTILSSWPDLVAKLRPPPDES